jgi:hypothetical protein
VGGDTRGGGLTLVEGPQRGVYFDAWFPRQHCYHPSLPPRRLRMIDDLESYRATMLVWSALGGGSISLPYLEHEAFGTIDPRFRFYGFVNDSEFIAACQERDIKVFGIVFEVQGWEFPAELNDEEDRVLALNEVGDIARPSWIGLREFSQDRYPKLWPPFESYFPGGLINSDGQRVTDLLEECCSRDIHGRPMHAHWVECPDRTHFCYTMDRNNPVWREYLKAVIRIQIDAGVDGVQLDEAELPITSMQYGGCFCKDCMKGFRSYLAEHPEVLPDDVSVDDLDAWHYGEWLLGRGFDFKTNQSEAPLFLDYLRFQRGQITGYFAELASYAREYGRSVGRDVLVSGNFFNLQDHYLPLEPEVDVIVTEMRNTTYRQPTWFRYAAGFGGRKPVVVVENPYGGVVPEMVDRLKTGAGYDLFRMSVYEAAALGVNMTIPYGAWLGSAIEDSFWAPHDLCVEVQGWLADHERLFSKDSAATTAVAFSTESNFELETRDRGLANNTLNLVAGDELAFWQVCDALSNGLQPYDVVFFGDGDVRGDEVTAGALGRFETVVLPHCHYLTREHALALLAYLDAGGRLVAVGPVGSNLPDDLRTSIVQHDRTRHAAPDSTARDLLDDRRQVQPSHEVDAAINLQRVPEGVAVHIIRYDYDFEADLVPPLSELTLGLTLESDFSAVEAYGAPRPPSAVLERRGPAHILQLQDVSMYTVVLLRREEPTGKGEAGASRRP